jgi:hypothetical protein
MPLLDMGHAVGYGWEPGRPGGERLAGLALPPPLLKRRKTTCVTYSAAWLAGTYAVSRDAVVSLG